MVAVTWLAPGLLLTERYRLVNRVAAGGMGEVWCATDTRLVRDVAVKVLRSELSDDPEFRRRFLLEAQITAALNAPSIAAVYDYGETVLGVDGAGPNVTYLVMELVDGEPLSAVLARQPRMPADRVLDVLEEAGNALDVAHQRGLVHRDVKPANILIHCRRSGEAHRFRHRPGAGGRDGDEHRDGDRHRPVHVSRAGRRTEGGDRERCVLPGRGRLPGVGRAPPIRG